MNLERFHYYFKIGVRPEQDSSTKRDIIFTNQAVFVLLFSSICIAIANSVVGCFWRVLVPTSTFIGLCSAYYFQHKYKYQKAKFFAILFPFLAAIASTILFGPLAKTQFYLGATLVLSIILFQKASAHVYIFLFHFLGIVGLLYWVTNGQPIIANQDSVYLGYFNICFIGLCVYITLTQFKVHYHRYEGKVKELFKSVQDQAAALQKQNKQIEQQSIRLIESNATLAREIKEKEIIQKQLLNSNEELERFAYVASHDLKEPLRTIGSFTQILQKELEPNADANAKEYFHFVIDGVKRMSALLDDLLALSRLSKEFSVAPIKLDMILEIVNLNLRNLITKNEGQLIIHPLPEIIGNKTQISQLFQNLISNGFKFKGEHPALVEISCEETSKHYQFKIKDNGIGISPKYQEQIFIIFKRLHTRDQYDGTGIGLAICKKVVSNHGGKIWLESEEGKGTSMYFTIKKKLGTSSKVAPRQILTEAQ